MKAQTLLFASILFLSLPFVKNGAGLFAQTPGEWTWMHGDNTPNPMGVFGVQGVVNPANKPPGVYEPCEWRDNNGNFWLFGGTAGVNGEGAALWKYDPTVLPNGQWIWMKGPSAFNQSGIYGFQGISAAANYPGSRGLGAATWVDASGNLWLFGGRGYDAFGVNGNLNDLWKYDPTVLPYGEWTWMKGPNTANDPGSYGAKGVSNLTNLPPCRYETSCTWTDNAGNLWLYGGAGGGNFGDLWKYTISTNEWTWMHGANTLNAVPVYGTQGLAAPANTPGGRAVYSSWTDLGGHLWLCGGGSPASKNDLWKYDPNPGATFNQWVWMKGPNVANDPGNYGTRCVSSNTNMLPARMENRARVRDACGNFWNFGGGGGLLNDLWHYNVATNQWTWVSGDNIPNQPAVYGTQGVSNSNNKPGAKIGSVAWIDNNGYIWVFGGRNGGSSYNDLFRYVPDPACVPLSTVITVSSNTTICMGQSATLTASGGITYSWSPGGQTSASVVITPTASTTYTVIGSSFCGSASSSVTVTVTSGITSSQSASICFGTTYTLPGGTVVSTSGTYVDTLTSINGCDSIITTTLTVAPALIGNQSATICTGATYTLPSGTVVSTNGTYIDTLTSVNGCDSIITTTLTVNPLPTVIISPNMTITQGTTTTLTSNGGGNYQWSSGETTQNINVSPIQTTTYCVTVTDANGCTGIACVTVTIEDPCSMTGVGELYMPNAFSPNNDGENDFLNIFYGDTDCIKEFHLVIYDRWGEKMFETINTSNRWDGIYKGKVMNSSVFVYYMNATLISEDKIIRKGNISLLR